MTDLSSEEPKHADVEVMADMAGELIQAKMEMAKKDTQMTHVLHVGSFHMEVIPDEDIDIRDMFNEILDKLIKKYGDKLLEAGATPSTPDGRHYG
jgi:hypothetical protein|tara:strand:- start:181 stop:465 length:285 start_codon:yes stop_codon:yes gene_type:complete